MSSYFKRLFLTLGVAALVTPAPAFSLLGPYEDWQVERIGYDPLGFDLGGPMNLGEEYRWNVKKIYYGYDSSFLNYFGAEGTNAIERAIAIFNALTNTSKMSTDLNEYPLETLRVNYQAAALGLLDVKSITMAMLLEELGLASPERYTWTLRARRETPVPVSYTVIKRNFDPVTLQPSSYVNGVLYTYAVEEFTQPVVFADATEIKVDPLQSGGSVVDSMGGFGFAASGFSSGSFYTGLTRDDVGGLRYLYRTNNYNIEQLPPGTLGRVSSGSPWQPIGGIGTSSNNVAVNIALRPGVDKITFVHGKFDSLLGAFITTTNVYTDTYVTNSTLKNQTVARVLTQPDILFMAEDLGLASSLFPITAARTGTTGWVDNSATNSAAALAGPGVINGPITISFSKVGPFLVNFQPNFLDELRVLEQGPIWASYDGSTNAPIVFPVGTSIYDLEQQVLFGGGGGENPWTVANSFLIITNTSSTTGGGSGAGGN